MAQKQDFYLITDVGSTTTKALIIDNSDGNPRILGINHANTTVEAPFNDVRYGVHKAVSNLQTQVGIPIFAPNASAEHLSFAENISYLTTSSAGGGLQILVIGLTLFDSASSARRAAYGAGGIILDVFAVDDKRKASEQMMAMRNLHPDMILLCGGTDGGALSGVLRMAEILRIAKPLPKFATDVKIPTIYAGNIDASDIVKRMIGKDFDLIVLPNLRPTLEAENLKPTQEMIQKLFMENVMERAPGYSELKQRVNAEILPTPMGVLKSLIISTRDDKRNFFAFDIGGATTDVFSYIKGNYQRTVSANLGMSYSALNVMAESGIEVILKQLPSTFTETEVRNYIGNKTLYPTYNPKSTKELRIEHAMAKQAVRNALIQHNDMHYNERKIGYLDALKKSDLDAYEAKFEYQAQEEKYYFYPSEIDVLIAAGGVFAHAQNSKQCTMMLIDAFDAHGITELWLDKEFITPHLGVLGEVDIELSKALLKGSCMQKLAVHVRPHYPHKYKKELLKLSYSEGGNEKHVTVMPDSFMVIPAQTKRKLSIQPMGKTILNEKNETVSLETDLMVIIDTRIDLKTYRSDIEQQMKLYSEDTETQAGMPVFKNENTEISDSFIKVVSLPYKGTILKDAGEDVKPDDVVASNKFNPPRLFIVNPFIGVHDVNEALVRDSLMVKLGDKIEFDMVLRHLAEKPLHSYIGQKFYSPVRGKLEMIDFSTGILVLSELQDYSGSPVDVNLAERMSTTPKLAMRYLKKKLGDFVYQGDLLAQRLSSTGKGEAPCFVRVPSTGQITEIDTKKAIVTIQYKISPHDYYAHVHGTVKETREGESITIGYRGTKLEGKLGLGNRAHGNFVFVTRAEDLASMTLTDCIVGIDFSANTDIVRTIAKAGAKGLICPGMNEKELVAFNNEVELGVINTGNEETTLCLILTEYFGATKLSPAFSAAFAKYNGMLCHMEPHTRIRAGVARPFICFMK
ncbi:MAG: glutamate mutase L [Candidatus Cloacimonetes bacterium]|nr:glutamate mutase L [Candidatus Cloacimonadota bacterium]